MGTSANFLAQLGYDLNEDGMQDVLKGFAEGVGNVPAAPEGFPVPSDAEYLVMGGVAYNCDTPVGEDGAYTYYQTLYDPKNPSNRFNFSDVAADAAKTFNMDSRQFLQQITKKMTGVEDDRMEPDSLLPDRLRGMAIANSVTNRVYSQKYEEQEAFKNNIQDSDNLADTIRNCASVMKGDRLLLELYKKNIAISFYRRGEEVDRRQIAGEMLKLGSYINEFNVSGQFSSQQMQDDILDLTQDLDDTAIIVTSQDGSFQPTALSMLIGQEDVYAVKSALFCVGDQYSISDIANLENYYKQHQETLEEKEKRTIVGCVTAFTGTETSPLPGSVPTADPVSHSKPWTQICPGLRKIKKNDIPIVRLDCHLQGMAALGWHIYDQEHDRNYTPEDISKLQKLPAGMCLLNPHSGRKYDLGEILRMTPAVRKRHDFEDNNDLNADFVNSQDFQEQRQKELEFINEQFRKSVALTQDIAYNRAVIERRLEETANSTDIAEQRQNMEMRKREYYESNVLMQRLLKNQEMAMQNAVIGESRCVPLSQSLADAFASFCGVKRNMDACATVIRYGNGRTRYLQEKPQDADSMYSNYASVNAAAPLGATALKAGAFACLVSPTLIANFRANVERQREMVRNATIEVVAQLQEAEQTKMKTQNEDLEREMGRLRRAAATNASVTG